jgi:hypothetical protein
MHCEYPQNEHVEVKARVAEKMVNPGMAMEFRPTPLRADPRQRFRQPSMLAKSRGGRKEITAAGRVTAAIGGEDFLPARSHFLHPRPFENL